MGIYFKLYKTPLQENFLIFFLFEMSHRKKKEEESELINNMGPQIQSTSLPE